MYECFVYIRSYNALTLQHCVTNLYTKELQQLNALNHI